MNNQGDVHTINEKTFASTYPLVSLGVYEKTSAVWAEKAGKAGTIKTKEGSTAYEAGDYLVYNGPNRKAGYAIKSDTFYSLYEPCD